MHDSYALKKKSLSTIMVLWDVTQCSLAGNYQCFEEIYCLIIQSWP